MTSRFRLALLADIKRVLRYGWWWKAYLIALFAAIFLAVAVAKLLEYINCLPWCGR